METGEDIVFELDGLRFVTEKVGGLLKEVLSEGNEYDN